MNKLNIAKKALGEIAYCVCKGKSYDEIEYSYLMWCKNKAKLALKQIENLKNE